MGRQSQHTAWNKATNMRCLVLIGSLLACSSSTTLEPGYGAPLAPVVTVQPAPVQPLPVQLVHNAPLIHSVPQPVLHSVPAPIHAPLPFNAPVPAPLPFNAPVTAPLAAPVPAPIPLAAPIPVAPVVEPPSSQFHAQDEFGQFSFGYQNINSAKTETKDAFGVTRGSYQYVDANGVLQTVNYIADDVNGFRVAGTNIPVAPEVAPVVAPVAVVDTPEVAAAKAEHLAAHVEAKAAAEAAVEKAKADATAADE